MIDVIVSVAQVISMILYFFRDQFGYTWKSRLLWVFRRLLFFMRSWFFDLFYYSIDTDDLLEALGDWRKEVLDKLEYTPEVFDCDDFAMYFKVWLQQWVKAIKGYSVNGVGVVLGVLKKNGEVLGGHAWNVVVVHTGSRPYILFVEPQLGELLSSTLRSSDGYEYEIQAVII